MSLEPIPPMQIVPPLQPPSPRRLNSRGQCLVRSGMGMMSSLFAHHTLGIAAISLEERVRPRSAHRRIPEVDLLQQKSSDFLQEKSFGFLQEEIPSLEVTQWRPLLTLENAVQQEKLTPIIKERPTIDELQQSIATRTLSPPPEPILKEEWKKVIDEMRSKAERDPRNSLKNAWETVLTELELLATKRSYVDELQNIASDDLDALEPLEESILDALDTKWEQGFDAFLRDSEAYDEEFKKSLEEALAFTDPQEVYVP